MNESNTDWNRSTSTREVILEDSCAIGVPLWLTEIKVRGLPSVMGCGLKEPEGSLSNRGRVVPLSSGSGNEPPPQAGTGLHAQTSGMKQMDPSLTLKDTFARLW